jgi:hypothetical protein
MIFEEWFEEALKKYNNAYLRKTLNSSHLINKPWDSASEEASLSHWYWWVRYPFRALRGK